MDDGRWMWGHGWGWVGWLLMCVFMLVFWAGLITAAVVGIRYLAASDRPPTQGDARRRPEDILAERYAAGEIGDDEFRRRLSLLREHRVSA